MGKVYEGFADEVINYRARHGLSQQGLADLCKTTKATINKIEAEKGGITKYTKAKIDNVIHGSQKKED